MTDSVAERSGVHRTGDEKIIVAENPSDDDRLTDMLCIRRGEEKEVCGFDGEVTEQYIEGTLANIPKGQGWAVLQALADYYGCEVKCR